MARKKTRTPRKTATRRAAAQKVRKLTRELHYDVDGLAHEITDRAGAAGAKAKAQLAALAHLAQERAHGAFEGFEQQIRARPALSLSAAMGVGVVAGLLLARRH